MYNGETGLQFTLLAYAKKLVKTKDTVFVLRRTAKQFSSIGLRSTYEKTKQNTLPSNKALHPTTGPPSLQASGRFD